MSTINQNQYNKCPKCGGRKRKKNNQCASCRGYGRKRHKMKNGYIRIYIPGHPVSAKDGYALEHRYILFENGIKIPKGFHVHHINGKKEDNRIENLKIITPKEHSLIHAESGIKNQFGSFPKVVERKCERCGNNFRPWTSKGRFCSTTCANRRHI
jgi:hypothetical protein